MANGQLKRILRRRSGDRRGCRVRAPPDARARRRLESTKTAEAPAESDVVLARRRARRRSRSTTSTNGRRDHGHARIGSLERARGGHGGARRDAAESVRCPARARSDRWTSPEVARRRGPPSSQRPFVEASSPERPRSKRRSSRVGARDPAKRPPRRPEPRNRTQAGSGRLADRAIRLTPAPRPARAAAATRARPRTARTARCSSIRRRRAADAARAVRSASSSSVSTAARSTSPRRRWPSSRPSAGASPNSGRWTRERSRWLNAAASVDAPPEKIARLERAPLSDEVVASARSLYFTTVDRSLPCRQARAPLGGCLAHHARPRDGPVQGSPAHRSRRPTRASTRIAWARRPRCAASARCRASPSSSAASAATPAVPTTAACSRSRSSSASRACRMPAARRACAGATGSSRSATSRWSVATFDAAPGRNRRSGARPR